MSQIKATKGKRQKLKASIGIAAASGAGKTLGAIFLAYGMMKKAYPEATEAEIWDKIGIVDTEHNRALYYCETDRFGVRVGEFWHVPVDAPFSVDRYVEAIDRLKSAGCEVVIVDSASHAWNKAGGLLEVHDEFSKGAGKNSYTAWRDVNPLEAKLNEAFFENDIHMIVTMRSKQEYAMEQNELGKLGITKLGTKPVQRDDMEYEFMTVLNMDKDHRATVSKDNTGLFDGKAFVITPAHGEALYDWLELGIDVRATQRLAAELAASQRKEKLDHIASLVSKHPEIDAMIKEFEQKAKKVYQVFGENQLNSAYDLVNFKLKEITPTNDVDTRTKAQIKSDEAKAKVEEEAKKAREQVAAGK